MTNAELIKALRCCASLDTPCKGLCPYHGVEYCLSKKDLDAADALEAAEKRIEELEDDLRSGTISNPDAFMIALAREFCNAPIVIAAERKDDGRTDKA